MKNFGSEGHRECMQTGQEEKTAHWIAWTKCSYSLGQGRAIAESTRASSGHREHQWWHRAVLKQSVNHSPISIPFSQCGFITQHYNDSLRYKLFQDQRRELCIETRRATKKNLKICQQMKLTWKKLNTKGSYETTQCRAAGNWCYGMNLRVLI